MKSYKPTYIPRPDYKINVEWDYLIDKLDNWGNKKYKFTVNPDFQRGHVWTHVQQVKYIEYKIAGGYGADEILFNCPGWMNDFKGPLVCVDGLQRLTAVIDFFNDGFKAHNRYKDDFGRFRWPDFIFCVNNLPNKKDVLKWYIELNEGGTPHTEDELNRVKTMLKGD